jgi:acyl-CoA reductase-like NAD-dependent aldehyde dehydrogenase
MASHLDTDLRSLQEARDLARQARLAATQFFEYTEKDARRIAQEVCKICVAQAEHYAERAATETGIGNTRHKVVKNLLASRDLLNYYQDVQLGGVRMDAERNVMEIARPAGVVFGLVPSTSPIATLYFKTLICLMTRNALILSPHPIARNCSIDAAALLADAAVRAGAPQNTIQIQRELTMESTHALMRSNDVDVILATGGSPMVRAAYSSGNPALGVGPGNVPVYVDRSASLDYAARDIVEGKAFDYGSPCSAPSVLIAHREIEQKLIVALRGNGAHICTLDEQSALESYAFPKGKFNAAIVGKPAPWIAERSGFAVPADTQILVATFHSVNKPSPMAKEKLSPILAITLARDVEEAIRIARAILSISGAGHTAGIYAEDTDLTKTWSLALDVNRIIVNRSTTLGAIGGGTTLAPTFTLGTGFAGKSSVSDNVGPQHLVNWRQVAYPSTAVMTDALASGKSIPRPQVVDAQFGQFPADLRTLVDAIVDETLASLRGKE